MENNKGKGFTAKDILDQKINEASSSDDKDAFYVTDLGDVLQKHLRWLKALPRVTPFSAVKCNDSRAIGTGHDRASKTEIQLVQSGVPLERVIYTNSCKQVLQIKFAASSGVQMMTFDSEVEPLKVAWGHPKAKLVLGIATDYSKARGSFPGSEDVKLKFEEITSVINPTLDKHYPADSGVCIIAKPGRYYVASAFTLEVTIIDKKLVWREQTGSDDEEEASEQIFMYYVNNRVYGSFNCILYDDHAQVKPLLQKRPKPEEKYYSSSIWGPTCYGCLVEGCDVPEVHVSYWMLFENMDAYTVARASTFNGFQRPTIYYVMSRPVW
ncbi:Ornithine decarboxylase [Heterocephalus glaber]|uniref:ornithine decarboxylase n=1 Tax=Heterocephalus glaber TaxID=10181 RepID=G5AQ79_HETGA|nr:Ornithine decarboxylase [Heterocephalus glaber]